MPGGDDVIRFRATGNDRDRKQISVHTESSGTDKDMRDIEVLEVLDCELQINLLAPIELVCKQITNCWHLTSALCFELKPLCLVEFSHVENCPCLQPALVINNKV